MTMPKERMRAIRFGLEMLDEAVRDDDLPPEARQRAELAIQDYPRASELAALLMDARNTLPSRWASALTGARSLFVDMLRLPGATEARTRALMATLRHFPTRA